MKIDLAGKVALVTGGSRGIGESIAQTLHGAGAKIALFGRDGAKAQATAKSLGESAHGYACDVGQSAQVEAAVAEVERDFGTIDILVNNAGTTRDNLMVRISEEDWDDVLETNLKGAFLMMKHAARGMIKRRAGRIINISSAAGQKGFVGAAAYAASKGGLNALTRVVAVEAAPYGVTCNVISPGVLDGGLGTALSSKIREAYLSITPLGRMGDPADVGELAVFLASPAGAYITGQIIGVNGGIHM